MSGERTNVPRDDEILLDADPVPIKQDPVVQYEKSFRRNRDDAVECGYDLCCPICGCAFNDDTEEWDHNHDGPLHRLYDAIKKG